MFRSRNELERCRLTAELVRYATTIAGDSAHDISGYAVVAWGHDGTTYSVWGAGENDRLLNYVTIPDYVRGILEKSR